MRQTHTRNVTAMHQANRRRWDREKALKAVQFLVEQGWVRSITADGLTLTEPRQEDSVKPSDND